MKLVKWIPNYRSLDYVLLCMYVMYVNYVCMCSIMEKFDIFDGHDMTFLSKSLDVALSLLCYYLYK